MALTVQRSHKPCAAHSVCTSAKQVQSLFYLAYHIQSRLAVVTSYFSGTFTEVRHVDLG